MAAAQACSPPIPAAVAVSSALSRNNRLIATIEARRITTSTATSTKPRGAVVVGTGPFRNFSDLDVAQVSKPAGVHRFCRLLGVPVPADLEIGDTAGLETCATLLCTALARGATYNFIALPPREKCCFACQSDRTTPLPSCWPANK